MFHTCHAYDDGILETTSKTPPPPSYIPNVFTSIEYKGSTMAGDYRPISPEINQIIHSNLHKGLQAFWVENAKAGIYYMFDFQTMQQHNISTGYRRSIRFRPQDFIDLTGSSAVTTSRSPRNTSSSSLCQFPASHSQTNGSHQRSTSTKQDHTLDICGPAFEGGWHCGPVANRKIAEIRQLHVKQSPLVAEMTRLAEDKQLFDPAPIPEDDSRFPIGQVRQLGRGGLTVHAVRPTRIWQRNRTYFDMLYAEEQKLYASHSTSKGLPQIKHFAWHGAPAHCIRGILECGFLVGPKPRVGNYYGHGVYLATETNARYSLNDRYSVPDVGGFKYLLLCEVLPGTAEISSSGQMRPTKMYVHSGVDKLPGASMHVFYTYDMNVRISPKFVVCIHPDVTPDIVGKVRNEHVYEANHFNGDCTRAKPFSPSGIADPHSLWMSDCTPQFQM